MADAVLLCPAPDGSSDADYESLYDRGITDFAAALSSRPPKRLLYTSSIGVWNVTDGRWVDESTPVDAVTSRQRALMAGEKRVRPSPLSGMVLRLGGIYGPGRHRLKEGNDSNPPMDGGNNFANTIHVDDVVGMVAFLIDKGGPGRCVCGGGQANVRYRAVR